MRTYITQYQIHYLVHGIQKIRASRFHQFRLRKLILLQTAFVFGRAVRLPPSTTVNASERQSLPVVAASARSFARLIHPEGDPWLGKRSESRFDTMLNLPSLSDLTDSACSFFRWNICKTEVSIEVIAMNDRMKKVRRSGDLVKSEKIFWDVKQSSGKIEVD
jgi:hypothetical protein